MNDYDPTDSDEFRAAIGEYVLQQINAGRQLPSKTDVETFKTWFRKGYLYGDSE